MNKRVFVPLSYKSSITQICKQIIISMIKSAVIDISTICYENKGIGRLNISYAAKKVFELNYIYKDTIMNYLKSLLNKRMGKGRHRWVD